MLLMISRLLIKKNSNEQFEDLLILTTDYHCERGFLRLFEQLVYANYIYINCKR
jgi:hypothetical protein